MHVETMTAGFNLCCWPVIDLVEAETLARQLSLRALDEPSLPNPVFIVEGKAVVKYDQGHRIQLS